MVSIVFLLTVVVDEVALVVDTVQVVAVLLDSGVYGAGADHGGCKAAVELVVGSLLKMPSGLIMFPSQSVESAILVGWGL